MEPAETLGVAIAISSDVPEGEVHPVVVDGTELAAWRGHDGAARLWEDRCPHRGMRLSFGFVRDNRLTCLYHGWEYGDDGACRKIPAHPEMTPPSSLCVTVRPASEKHGMILMGGAPGAGAGDGPWHGVRTVFVDLPADRVRDALPEISDAGWTARDELFVGRRRDHAVSLGVQPVSDACTAVHVTTTNPDRDARVAIARDLVAYRRGLAKGPA